MVFPPVVSLQQSSCCLIVVAVDLVYCTKKERITPVPTIPVAMNGTIDMYHVGNSAISDAAFLLSRVVVVNNSIPIASMTYEMSNAETVIAAIIPNTTNCGDDDDDNAVVVEDFAAVVAAYCSKNNNVGPFVAGADSKNAKANPVEPPALGIAAANVTVECSHNCNGVASNNNPIRTTKFCPL